MCTNRELERLEACQALLLLIIPGMAPELEHPGLLRVQFQVNFAIRSDGARRIARVPLALKALQGSSALTTNTSRCMWLLPPGLDPRIELA
jgi:hypothetical protein